jgi:hypothetical protein
MAPPGRTGPTGYGTWPPSAAPPERGRPPAPFSQATFGPVGPAPGAATAIRHRPGIGLVVGLVGLGILLLSLTTLPWISSGGTDVTLADIRDELDRGDDADGGDVPTTEVPDLEVPDLGEAPGPTTAPRVQRQQPPPTTGPVTPTVPTPKPAAPTVDDYVYIEAYARYLWIAVTVAAAVAVFFTTVLVPRAKAARVVIGFLTSGVIGLAVNATDDDGTVGPRVSGVVLTLLCAGVHGFAAFDLFGRELSPDPAIGVWAGLAGLALVLVACVIGTRWEQVPVASPGGPPARSTVFY